MNASRLHSLTATAAFVMLAGVSPPLAAAPLDIAQEPLYLATGEPPLNMLVMGRDHKLYYEAYNDASDLNGDGVLDVGYKPAEIDYFGYFDSHRCYTYASGTRRFTPGSAAINKQCSGSWSGDFLNYLTTSRMDALRKVLYGGHRVVDTGSDTVLERAYVPQDAHSWGKEYTSIERDGYDIRSYAPLPLPESDRRHLFANTTLRNSENSGPLLRVVTNSPYRIWHWVSKENPVAGDSCRSETMSGGCASGTTTDPHPGHPGNRSQFDQIEADYALPAFQFGTNWTSNTIDCNSSDCNKRSDQEDNYLTIVTGYFRLRNANSAAGRYEFRVHGDDAIDVQIRRDGPDGALVGEAGCYGGRGFDASCSGTQSFSADLPKNATYWFKFRHEEMTGGDGYRLQIRKTSGNDRFGWQTLHATSNHNDNLRDDQGPYSFSFYNLVPTRTTSELTDYRVQVAVCVGGALEDNCKRYPDGNHKPTGLLHDYGESERMYFGLLTGSYEKNTQGGVLRRNISSFASEIDADDGTFRSDVTGIVRTIDRLRTIDFTAYQYSCGWIANRPINDGECRMWGNPVAEMMYETLRYYAGAPNPRPEYAISGSAVDSNAPLNLPRPSWTSPYKAADAGGGGYRSCAVPVMTVISDINPSYDGQVPGSNWGALSAASDPSPLDELDAAEMADAIWGAEGLGTINAFIGESGGVADAAPTVKSVSNLSSVRGLAPEEPSKQGTYYSAGIARFGAENQIGGDKKALTYAVALASPLPTLRFPVGGSEITLVPFAKSPYGRFGGNVNPGDAFQPTNQIVDFYVEKIVNTDPNGGDRDASVNGGRPYAEFRINYEDVEQGADHDMDAIVRYVLSVTADNKLNVSLRSEHASGSIVQYIGYIISGTTKDGVYLEVSDCDTASSYPGNGFCPSGNNPGQRYKLNTPPGRDAGYCMSSGNLNSDRCWSLPYETTRTFTPGSSDAAQLLKDPLWYAAKHGRPSEMHWDVDEDGTPDNYFLVTNAGELKDQLSAAFAQIERDARPTGGVAASGARRDEGFLAYVPEYNAAGWSGELRAYLLQASGRLGVQVWQATERMPEPAERNVFAVVDDEMVEFLPQNLGASAADQVAALGLGATELATSYDGLGVDAVVDYFLGVDSNEQENGGPFRDRSSALGDILNSQPEVLSKGSYNYTSLPDALGGGYEGAGSYGEFLEQKQSRTPVVFVGSNGGMLHGFDARGGEEGGRELFAVIPNSALSGMSALLSPGYTHRYYVDGSPLQHDAWIGGSWKTVLVTTMGAGGRSVLALDVTDPANDFGADSFLWEFSHAELGYTLGQVRIGLLENDTWVAVFGNGYNSNSETASLFVVDLATGNLLQRIVVNSGGTGHNGMAGPALADTNLNGRIDTAYAGDLHGNIWKFDLSGTPGTWSSAFGASTPLFVARSPSGERQQITGAPAVSRHHSLGQMVFIGTGRYFLDGDNAVLADPPVDSFYGLWDNNNNADPITARSELQRQFIEEEVHTSAGPARITSENLVDWSSKRGWLMDLQIDNGTTASPAGERFLGRPRVALGRVIFTTFTPRGDECQPGGDNWLYSLSATDGANMLTIPEGAIDPDGPDGPLQPEAGCPDCGGMQVGEGAPAVVPPIVTTPPDTPEPVCLPNDPDCEPTPPCDPETDPTCVPDPHGDKIKIGVLMAEGGLVTFIYITPGRQSWRQIE